MFSKSVRRLGQQDGGQSVSAVRAGFREAEGTGVDLAHAPYLIAARCASSFFSRPGRSQGANEAPWDKGTSLEDGRPQRMPARVARKFQGSQSAGALATLALFFSSAVRYSKGFSPAS